MDRNNTKPDFYLPSANTVLELKSLTVDLTSGKRASDRIQAAKREKFQVYGTVHISLDEAEAQSFSRRMTGQLLKSISKASDQLNCCIDYRMPMKGVAIFAEIAEFTKIDWDARYLPNLDMIRMVVDEGMRDEEIGIDFFLIFTINENNLVNVDAMKRVYKQREFDAEFAQFRLLLGKIARLMPFQFLNK